MYYTHHHIMVLLKLVSVSANTTTYFVEDEQAWIVEFVKVR